MFVTPAANIPAGQRFFHGAGSGFVLPNGCDERKPVREVSIEAGI
jgi:hypothetical protein